MKRLSSLGIALLLLSGCNENVSTKTDKFPIENIILRTEVIETSINKLKNQINEIEVESKKEDTAEENKTEAVQEVKETKNEDKQSSTVTSQKKETQPSTQVTTKNNSKNSGSTSIKQETAKTQSSQKAESKKEVQKTEEVKQKESSEPIKQEAMAKKVMAQINAYRKENGLGELESTAYQQEKADTHAYNMAVARALFHSNNGECITNHPDSFNAWKNSSEHNAILLRENNTKGVVSIYYIDGYYYSVFQTSW